MADNLHRLQPVGLPTMVARAPHPAPEHRVAAVASGASARRDPHPDLSAQEQPGQRTAGRVPIEPPPNPPTGPPPAFEANVLEVESRARRDPTRAAEVDRNGDTAEIPGPSAQKWQAPAVPEPALINLQL